MLKTVKAHLNHYCLEYQALKEKFGKQEKQLKTLESTLKHLQDENAELQSQLQNTVNTPVEELTQRFASGFCCTFEDPEQVQRMGRATITGRGRCSHCTFTSKSYSVASHSCEVSRFYPFVSRISFSIWPSARFEYPPPPCRSPPQAALSKAIPRTLEVEVRLSVLFHANRATVDKTGQTRQSESQQVKIVP